MFMTSIFDVINTINLDVYDVDIRRHKHDQLIIIIIIIKTYLQTITLQPTLLLKGLFT
jgi:hypothetical protein